MSTPVPTASSNVVTGKRVAWWRGVLAEPGMALYVFGSPPLLFFALFELVFRHAGMDGLGYFFWGFLAVVAFAGCYLLYLARSEGPPVEAPCPVCGTRGIWPYQVPVDVTDPVRQICNACGAYAGVNGLELREVALDATGEFELLADRYKKHCPRNKNGDALLELPPFCAICGATDAPARRAIDVGAGASVNDELWKQVSYARTGSRGRSTSSISDAIRMDLHHVEIPVCEQHASTQPVPVRADPDATLRFASYRYYRAFCAANRITR